MTTPGNNALHIVSRRFERRGATSASPVAVANSELKSENSPRTAVSLVEILITVTLLSVIVLGLLGMFSLTQRAFRSGMTQTDVLESGRATMDLMTRELEQTVPSYRNAVNFFVQIPPSPYTLLRQTLPGGSTVPQRSNVLQDLFFLTRQNQTWVGIGYCVRANNGSSIWPPDSGVGTLYRFIMATNVVNQDRAPAGLKPAFDRARLSTTPTSLNRVADGVVHFRVAMFDTNGVRLTWNLTNTIIGGVSSVVPGEFDHYYFLSNAVPASVEVELGILEAQTLGRYLSMTSSPAIAQAYLREQAGRVHLFRQRVPIRNVDPEAYQ